MTWKIEDFKENGGKFVSKIIQPGTHLCRIIDVEVAAPAYDQNKLQVNFLMETEPIGGDFEGVLIDKNDPKKGSYQGQIGYVKNGQYAFGDWVTPSGEKRYANNEACDFIARLCVSLGVWDAVKVEPKLRNGVTAAELAEVAKKHICNPNLWAYYTIGGVEKWQDGYDYPNYYLHFVKYQNRKNYVSLKKDGVVPFDEDVHIIKRDKGVSVNNNTTTDIPTFEDTSMADMPNFEQIDVSNMKNDPFVIDDDDDSLQF